MKLYEEFKVYEKLWEAVEPDPVDKVLQEYDDFKFDYDGFTEDGYEDRFDPGSAYGHYQTYTTHEHDDYTYTVDAVDIFEALKDDILPNARDTKNSFAAEYKKLEAVWENSKNDADADAADMFLAKNLDVIANEFYYELKDYYSEAAYNWARDNW
jgi:hypothetical protein